ncbi:MAG: TrbI/VirB10 family protein [Sphingomonadaceae bacterium]|nr:TrbI/VirB10 family protein [Sphingomonadaceae bacterium]
MRGALPGGSVATDPRPALGLDALEAAQEIRYPQVAARGGAGDWGVLAAGGVIAVLLGALTFNSLRRVPEPRTAAVQPAPVPNPAPAANAPAPQPVPALLQPAPPVQQPQSQPLAQPARVVTVVQPAAGSERAPVLVFDNAGPVASATAPGVAAPPIGAAAAPPKAPATDLTAEELFARRIGGEGATASATRIDNPATTVAQGTLMSAVLETALDSDTPGFVRAVISRDVRGFDGSAVLVPRGSHVIGQYKSGLAVGQTRAFILWTRLIRPDGVSIDLASPATDSAGRNGLTGKVDSHFVKRFSGAILLSLIPAVGQAIGGGGTSIVLAGPQQAVGSAASQNLSIPPTVRVAQGAPIRIFVARDLDFSTASLP